MGRGQPAGAVHQMALERVFVRMFAAFGALFVVVFWFSSSAVSGQQPGSVAANLLLSVLLIWQAARALRRPLSRRDLCVLAAATGSLLLASRALAVPGSPFLNDAAFELVTPTAIAWAVWSDWLVVSVPVLLIVLATGAWQLDGDLPVEQAGAVLAVVACTFWASRLVRAGACRADTDADVRSQHMAEQDAALAAEEAERRAANAVHDDVLSVLRAVNLADRQVPWSLVVSKARLAQDALVRQMPRTGHGLADLRFALRRVAGSAAELDVQCDLDGQLDMPLLAVEALDAAVGEALRNVEAHAGVRSAMLTARRSQSDRVTVTVSDDGIGFDPARVRLASTGLRNSVRARLSDIGGRAEVISAPGQGTSVVLTWSPPRMASALALDPLASARRMAPSPQLIFAGLMLPILLFSLLSLGLRWQDMRWQAAAAAAFGGMTGLAILSARYLSQVRMMRPAAVGLTVANAILAIVGSLAVAPGTTDASAYWVGIDSGIVIAAVYFIRGPAFGLTALALDLTALTAGMLVTGGAISPGEWVITLTGPAIGAGVAATMLAAFRSLSSRTESQLAEYRDRLRRQARAEAINRVDNATLDNARRIAGPVLDAVISSPAPDPDLRIAAALASATLRDELLAPGFLTPPLAERVRATRTAGANIIIDFARQPETGLAQTARELLAAALAGLDAGSHATLQVHPPTRERPALLILHVRSRQSDHAALRRHAGECGALISDLGDHEFLVRLQPRPERTAVLAPRGDIPL